MPSRQVVLVCCVWPHVRVCWCGWGRARRGPLVLFGVWGDHVDAATIGLLSAVWRAQVPASTILVRLPAGHVARPGVSFGRTALPRGIGSLHVWRRQGREQLVGRLASARPWRGRWLRWLPVVPALPLVLMTQQTL